MMTVTRLSAETRTGKDFHPRIILGRASFFVDPPADMLEAELAGLEDAGLSDKELQDRMMFWRYAMFIEEKLNPKLPEKTDPGLQRRSYRWQSLPN